jgi:trimeric autotransporter adhesin
VSNTVNLISALANTAAGRIVLAPGTYILSAELSVTRSIVLEAAVAGSVVLNAQASSSSPRRVLYINPGQSGVVQLIGLAITGGSVGNGNNFMGGGGVFINNGTVTLSSCTITGNTATYGGGVYVWSGTVSIVNSQIYSNTAPNLSGVSAYWGGGGVAIFGGTVSIVNSQIYSNTASRGGGVYVSSGTVTITSSSIWAPITVSSIIENTVAATYGGGVYVAGGAVAISSCTISGNTAFSAGGGVAVFGGTVAISSCTISRNKARAYSRDPCSVCGGGAVYVNGGDSTVSIVNSQIYSNTVYYVRGGGGRRLFRHSLNRQLPSVFQWS